MAQRFVLIISMLATASLVEAESWDGPLLTVQQGKIILQHSCVPGRTMTWTEDVARKALGLKTGDAVWALTTSGKVEATLRGLSCFRGECGEHYAAIDLELETGKPDDVLAVVKRSFLDTSARIEPTHVDEGLRDSECSDIYSRIVNKDFPEEPAARKCMSLKLSGDTDLKLVNKGFMQENGWVLHHVQARMGSNGSVAIDVDTNPLEPKLLIREENSGDRILWRKSSGICCPSAVTLKMSRITPGGELVLGRGFTAGGQPCD